MSVPYWDDFTDKYGFNDGNDVPADAEMIWLQNVLAINRCAEKTGSKVRAVRWMRNGMHNPFLICIVPVEFYDALPREVESAEGVLNWHIKADFGDEAEWDDAFSSAVWMAGEILSDSTCVVTTVEWSEEAWDEIAKLIDEADVSEYLNDVEDDRVEVSDE